MSDKPHPDGATRRFGDRWIVSPWPLEALPVGACPVGEPVITVRLGASNDAPAQWNHHWRGPGGEVQMSLAVASNGYWLRLPDMGDFLLDLAHQDIQVFPATGLDENTLEHLLVDQVLPRFLAGMGDLVMHASAVILGGKTLLFLGRSGWGKSTLAGLLCAKGGVLLSDDCVVLRTTGSQVTAIPTYPSLRLFKDSVTALGEDGAATRAVASYTRKRRLPMPSGLLAEPAPVAAVYVLSDPADGGSETSITPLAPGVACMKLIENAFQLDLTDGRHMAGQFAEASAAARAVNAFTLAYPRDYAGTDALTRAVVNHAARMAGANR